MKYAEVMAREIAEHYAHWEQEQRQISSSNARETALPPQATPKNQSPVQEEAATPVSGFVQGVAAGFMDAVQDAWSSAKAWPRGVADFLWQPRTSGGKESKKGADDMPGVAESRGLDVQHLLEESLLSVFVEGLFDIRAYDFPGAAGY